jgi:hypothetical protein
MNPTSGRTPLGSPGTSHHLLTTAALGGLLGLSLGLILWAFSLVRPQSFDGSEGLTRNVAGRSTGSARGGVAALGPEAAQGPRDEPSAGVVDANESPKAAATHYAWVTRFLLHDMDGALGLIQSNLQGDERTKQEQELINALVPHNWTEIAEIGSTVGLEDVCKKAGGARLLEKRWELARKTTLALADSALKVGYLSRMELLAGAFRDARKRPPETRTATASEPLRESNEKGEPLEKPKDENRSISLAIDFAKESESLASDARSVLSRLDSHPWQERAGQWFITSWHLARTGLLTLGFALTSSVGAVLLKSYSKIIGERIDAVVPVKQLLGVEGKSAVGSAQDKPDDEQD